MIIFLDFDGVMRPTASPPYEFDPRCLAAFEETVRSLPEARIVISSSWRTAFSLDEMRRYFSPDIRPRIVGATPRSDRLEGYPRHRAVLAYLHRNGLAGEPWVAIDDDASHFPSGSPVIVTDAARGFDAAAATKLRERASPGEEPAGSKVD